MSGAGSLFVVATPIGNLEDLSPRARRTLEECDFIACEDTRVTSKLLAKFEIRTSLVSHHAHSLDHERKAILDRILEGRNGALVSDAGAPLISDPGAWLVADAIAAGVSVIPIPGPSAVITALMASGLDASRFVFLGFLPRGAVDLREALRPYAALPVSIVLFESKERLAATLQASLDVFGPRRATVARELTKRYETFVRDRLDALVAKFAVEETLGEVTIVVGPPEASEAPAELSGAEVEARRLLDAGMAPSEVAKALAATYSIPRKKAYAIVLGLSKGV